MGEATAPAKHRSLLPKEHGAYAQLLGPLLVALGLARAALPALLLAAGALCVFLAHEPLLIRLGQRGRRAAAEDGARAARRALGLLSIAVVAGGAGLALSTAAAWGFAAAPVVLGGVLAEVIRRRQEKTLGGEVLAALALTAAALPVAVAGGVSHRDAGWIAFAFGLGFTATTLAVRSVIAHAKGRARGSTELALAALTAILLAAVAAAGRPALAPAPLLLSSWGLVLLGPAPRHLRTVGVVLVGATLASGALLLAG